MYSFQRNKLCGAVRLSDGTHVVLQLLAINEDGQDEVEILKRLHEKPISTKFRNRAVPLLDLITFACETGNLVFGVFPLLCPGFNTPGPGNAIEAFETVRQMFEVSIRRTSTDFVETHRLTVIDHPPLRLWRICMQTWWLIW